MAQDGLTERTLLALGGCRIEIGCCGVHRVDPILQLFKLRFEVFLH
jgi:hypothetical protein